MGLGEMLGASQLSGLAPVALVIFFAAFVAILLHVVGPRRQADYERARRLPLEDEPGGRAGDGPESGAG